MALRKISAVGVPVIHTTAICGSATNGDEAPMKPFTNLTGNHILWTTAVQYPRQWPDIPEGNWVICTQKGTVAWRQHQQTPTVRQFGNGEQQLERIAQLNIACPFVLIVREVAHVSSSSTCWAI